MPIRVSQEDVDCVFEQQLKFHPKEKLSKKKKDLIKQRLKDGYTIPDLVRAIIGCHNTPHNQGENERGTKYLGLHVSIRSWRGGVGARGTKRGSETKARRETSTG